MQRWMAEAKESYYDGLNYYGSRLGAWYCIFYYIVHGNWWVHQFCKVFGHKMENDAEISCDHAVEYLYCSRCGWSKRIIYY